MVFFTCNVCGESIKKPAVAKHYNTKCRGAPKSVSCMDCQKDFKGEEYVEHTSCITEAEKYSGKDYVPKPSHNAGLKKQQCWLEVVRSILSATDIEMSADVRRTLQRLQSYDNVPRKKYKFINFIVNCLRINRNQAEPVWNVVEVALEKYKEIRFGSKKTDEATQNGENENVDEQNINGNSEEASNGDAEEKKNKKKKKKQEKTDPIEAETSILAETAEEVPKKKKKKDKERDESIIQNGSIDTKMDVPSSKKKKKHSNGIENEVPNGIDSVEIIEIAEEDAPPKKKKKKHSNGIENEVPNGIHSVETINIAEEDAPSKKKKKKSADKDEPTIANKLETTPKPIKKPITGRFDWNNEIHSVIEKYSEIEVEKLRNKILKKFKKINEIDEIPYKVEKTFNKKLRKSGLLVVDNIVKIKN